MEINKSKNKSYTTTNYKRNVSSNIPDKSKYRIYSKIKYWNIFSATLPVNVKKHKREQNGLWNIDGQKHRMQSIRQI